MKKNLELRVAGACESESAGADGGLTPAHHRAWGALLRSHAGWLARIETRLADHTTLSVEAYDVLLTLSYAPGARLRMGELHERVTLSRSGLTRLVDRLERDGFVRREVCPSDRRSFEAILTDEGETERVRTWPLYAHAIREEFARYYSDDEARMLCELLERPLASATSFHVPIGDEAASAN